MTKKDHFHSLDALRFIAFLMVFLFHIPIQGDFPVFKFLTQNGSLGVIFFFVLSGFLITYILVHEKINAGRIHLLKFFIRRSLRIWPLYLLMVFVAFKVPYSFADKIGMHMVGGGYLPDWKYSFTFLENYKMLLCDNFPRTTPLPVFWSLCIEEHFYLIWMCVLFFIPIKRLKYFFIISIFIGIISRWVETKTSVNTMISSNDIFTNIDLFSTGALLGLAVAKNQKLVKTTITGIHTAIKTGYLLIVLLAILFHNQIFPWENLINRIISQSFYGLLFTGVIAVFINGDSKFRIPDKNFFSQLGQISYGLYVFHILSIHLLFQYFLQHQILIDDSIKLGTFILITFLSTYIISLLSYHSFEKPFLLLREKIKFKEI